MSLLVVGALHWDVVVTADRLPRIDETLRGDAVDYRFGGKGGNQAVAAARAGARVGFAGRIGRDDAGRAMRAVLEGAGVNVTGLVRGGGASGMSVAITVADGGYGAVIVSGENLKIDAKAVDIPEDCRIVLLQNESAPGLLSAMAPRVRDAGAALWLNAAPATGIGPEALALVDTLIVNRIEGADLLGADPGTLSGAEMVEGLMDLAPRARIVLTLGGDGVAFAEAGGKVRLAPARKVDVVSTHGAGDTFVGTLAAAELAGASLGQAIEAAQGAAALLISQTR
ncbi:MAG: ribokinase [Rhodobacteraceae bacterium HLUCCA08]|nr:MAG: ribokinase [Rhodobacteraceae bacterium HLUCCA08]